MAAMHSYDRNKKIIAANQAKIIDIPSSTFLKWEVVRLHNAELDHDADKFQFEIRFISHWVIESPGDKWISKQTLVRFRDNF